MQNPTEWLNFDEYVQYSRLLEQGYYDIKWVKKRFYEALSLLGKPDKRDTLVAITLRLKNKVKVKTITEGVVSYEYVKTDWRVANAAANALRIKANNKFKSRSNRKDLLPYVRAIETNRNGDKDHIHALIRMNDLKRYYEPYEISDIITKIAYGLEEVNSRDKGDNPAVKVRTFPYCEDRCKVLGRSIEYICKTSTNACNPLENKITAV